MKIAEEDDDDDIDIDELLGNSGKSEKPEGEKKKKRFGLF
jgi:hypothetical protein